MTNPNLKIDRAATIPGEDVFLDQLVDNLTDSACKLVYADWLEERGDELRATALRQYHAAFQSMEPSDFPDISLLPSSWARMTGLALVREIAQQDAAQYRDQFLQLARPALTINADMFGHLYEIQMASDDEDAPDCDPSTPVGSSKIFGLPDLPDTAHWPRQKDCNCNFVEDSSIDPEAPCSFVAQINFADFIGTQAYRWMPKGGLLSIFTCAEIESIGMTDCYLTYAKEPKNLVRHSAPDELADDEANPILGSLGWTVEETLDIPQAGRGSPFPLLNRNYSDPLYDVFRAIRRSAGDRRDTLLGYTYPTTGDDPLPGAEWLSLVCLQNTLEQRLHFAIKAEHLRQGKFDEARTVWFDFD